jgi:hypothetical protein
MSVRMHADRVDARPRDHRNAPATAAAGPQHGEYVVANLDPLGDRQPLQAGQDRRLLVGQVDVGQVEAAHRDRGVGRQRGRCDGAPCQVGQRLDGDRQPIDVRPGAGALDPGQHVAPVGGKDLASMATGRHPTERPGRRFAVMAAAFPTALLVLILIPGLPGVLLAAALTGTGMASGVLENLMLQTWVPDRLRGRVYSFDVLVSLCAIPLGYLLAGAAIDTGSARPVAGTAAGLCLVAAAAAAASPLAHHHTPAAGHAGA